MEDMEIKKEEETDSDEFEMKEEETELKEQITYSFDCSPCQKTFSTSKDLKLHENKSHVIKNKPVLSCSDCKKKFKYLSHLKRHRRIHSGDKPFRCSHC